MATIDHVLGNLTLDQLRGVKEGRGHIWHEVSKVFTSADPLVRFCAERLFEPPRQNYRASGLLWASA
jgi:hypothetical protein